MATFTYTPDSVMGEFPEDNRREWLDGCRNATGSCVTSPRPHPAQPDVRLKPRKLLYSASYSNVAFFAPLSSSFWGFEKPLQSPNKGLAAWAGIGRRDPVQPVSTSQKEHHRGALPRGVNLTSIVDRPELG